MNTFKINLFTMLISSMTFCQMIHAQDADKTLAPYFRITSNNTGQEDLPLKSTTADVTILGVIADVTIEQTYKNTGTSAIEAVYVFPGSTQAAVYDMEMHVGGRVIRAVIHEKQEAKKKYEQAKEAGKKASLLEQERPNVFTMNVANIAPGETISVVLKYTEKLIPNEGIYTFVYPTVVGPRFTGEQTKKTKANSAAVPYTEQGSMPLYEFDIDVQVNAGLPLQDVTCATHKIDIAYDGLNKAKIELDATEEFGGDRDFVLQYQLAGKKINSGLLVYEGEEENHFMLTVQPPKRITDADIPQREYIFIVDVSGSMAGFPMNVSKKLMRNLIGNLRPTDKFNLMLFASASTVFAPESVYADEVEINKALKILDGAGGYGGTRLKSALTKAMELPKCEDGLSRSIVVITDGYISVERDVFDLIKNNSEFNFYAFGIGSSVNRLLIEGMAHVGGGEPLIVKNGTEANDKAEAFRKFISAPVMTDISVNWGDFDVYDLEPSSFKDLMAEKPVVISGKYKGDAKGTIELKGISGEQVHRTIIDASLSKSDISNRGLSYLWARERIKILDDYVNLDQSEENKAEVLALGLKYNLLTKYTSFLAIDEMPQFIVGEDDHLKKGLKTVRQPLPLPKGTPNAAISTPINLASVQSYGAALAIENHLPTMNIAPMKESLSLKKYRTASATILKKRPSITFVMGTDEDNESYFHYAKQFFLNDVEERTDYFVDTCTSLISLRNYLANHLPEGHDAWGAINIVCHANQWTGMKVSLDGKAERTNLGALLDAVANGSFQPLSNDVIDRHSLIHVRACGLGENEPLLAGLQVALGGADQDVPGLKSDKDFVFFSNEEDGIDLKTLTPYYAFYKTAYRPAEIHLAKQLKQRYPDSQINWRAAMQSTTPRFAGDAFHTRFNVPVVWDLVFDENAAVLDTLENFGDLAFVKTQTDLMQLLAKYNIPVDKFRWTITKEHVGEDVFVKIKGKSTVLCVLVEENKNESVASSTLVSE